MDTNRIKRLIPGKPTLIIIMALIAVFLLIATRPSDTPEPRRERAWAVDVVPAQPATLSPTLELFGRVQSPQNSELSAAIEAVVISLEIRDGDSVASGDTLLVLDDRDARLTLQQNEADLKEAQAQNGFAKIRLDRARQAYKKEKELLEITQKRANRAEEIFAEGLLSQADLENTTENLARQQLAVNLAELSVQENKASLIELEARIARFTALRDRAALDLERTRIKALFPGVISDLQVSEGDRVRVGDPLMRLQNPESLEIRAQLPTRYAESINAGIDNGLVINARVQAEDSTISGQVLRVSGSTRAGSGGVDSFIGLKNNRVGLRLGSTVRVLLDLPPEEGLIALPGEAVYGRDVIYRIDGDRMELLQVDRIGERELEDGRTEVLIRSDQLVAGDQVIVTKLANAANGLLVTTTNMDGAADIQDTGATRTADNGAPAKTGPVTK